MFRPMRRSKQELSREESMAILGKGTVGILGVQGDDGYPYTVPVNYIYVASDSDDDLGTIYFHGAKQGHKVDAIDRSDKVTFCVIDADTVVPEELTTYFRSVIAFGRARMLDDPDEARESLFRLGMKYWPNTDGVNHEIDHAAPSLACFAIKVEHLTGKESKELVRARKQEER